MDIELLYFVLMIAAFIVSITVFKLPTGVGMMIGAFLGMVVYCFTAPTRFVDIPRHLVDGAFGYIDPILTIAMAMVFMKTIEKGGAIDRIGVFVVEKFRRFPTLLLISLMVILMLPGMITGSSATAVVTSGALVGPILLAIGVPKKESVAIVAIGSVLGMIAPPINIPVMVICDIVDMPYIGFELPLLLLTIPVAIFSVLFLGRKHVKKVDLEEIKSNSSINFGIKEEVNWTVFIPLIILVILMVIVNAFPQILPPLGMPLVFLIATIPAIFLGKKKNFIYTSAEALKSALPVMAMLLGVGMLVQAMTFNGVRGMIVLYVMYLDSVKVGIQPILLYLGVAVFVPLIGAISPFGSSSIFGGPVIMALQAIINPIIAAACMSMLASVGDLIPPSALAGRTSTSVVEYDGKYGDILKKLIVPISVMIVYSMVIMVFVGQIW